VISQSNAARSPGPCVVTLKEFQHWQSRACWNEPPPAMDTKEFTLLGWEWTERLFGVRVTADLFRVFKVIPRCEVRDATDFF
jgi:hypothetical protein